MGRARRGRGMQGQGMDRGRVCRMQVGQQGQGSVTNLIVAFISVRVAPAAFNHVVDPFALVHVTINEFVNTPTASMVAFELSSILRVGYESHTSMSLRPLASTTPASGIHTITQRTGRA
jgi:hypothetical protein